MAFAFKYVLSPYITASISLAQCIWCWLSKSGAVRQLFNFLLRRLSFNQICFKSISLQSFESLTSLSFSVTGFSTICIDLFNSWINNRKQKETQYLQDGGLAKSSVYVLQFWKKEKLFYAFAEILGDRWRKLFSPHFLLE